MARRRVREADRQLRLEGETGLIVAFLKPLAHDLQPPSQAIRAEAATLVNDERALAQWTEAIDVDPSVFQCVPSLPSWPGTGGAPPGHSSAGAERSRV
jgi:hypothetical protein